MASVTCCACTTASCDRGVLDPKFDNYYDFYVDDIQQSHNQAQDGGVAQNLVALSPPPSTL